MNKKLIVLSLAGLLLPTASFGDQVNALIEDSVAWQFQSANQTAVLQAQADLRQRKKNGFFDKSSLGGALAAAGGGGAGGGSVIGNLFQNSYEITIDGDGNQVQGGEVSIEGDQANNDSEMKAQSNSVESGTLNAQ